MASTKLYLDTRNKRAASYPLTLAVSASNKSFLLPLGLHLRPDEWRGGQVIGRPDKNRLNAYIRAYRARVDNILLSLSVGGKLPAMERRDIKAAVLAGLNPDKAQEEPAVTFREVAEAFLATKTGRTLEIYRNTLRKVQEVADLDTLALDDVSVAWLEDFEAHLLEAGRINTAAIDLRNIRAIFNFARRQGKTKEYPFLNFRIKREATRHRHNPPELLCLLRSWPVEEHQRKYRDIYLLIFYLIGINIVDLCHARRADVVQGRLEYRRRKTGKLYSVKIPPEAWDIIHRYQGREYLLDILDSVSDYRYFAKALNRNLGEVGFVRIEGRGGKKHRTPILPENTTYWARHSWATIAHRIGIPKDTISLALGHSFGVETTDTYIDYNADDVDQANRKVLDYLNQVEHSQEFADLVERLAVLGALI